MHSWLCCCYMFTVTCENGKQYTKFAGLSIFPWLPYTQHFVCNPATRPKTDIAKAFPELLLPQRQRWLNPLLHLSVVHRRLLYSWSRWTSGMSPATLQLSQGSGWICPATPGHLAICHKWLALLHLPECWWTKRIHQSWPASRLLQFSSPLSLLQSAWSSSHGSLTCLLGGVSEVMCLESWYHDFQ